MYYQTFQNTTRNERTIRLFHRNQILFFIFLYNIEYFLYTQINDNLELHWRYENSRSLKQLLLKFYIERQALSVMQCLSACSHTVAEYSCEYEYLNFAVNLPKNCNWIRIIFLLKANYQLLVLFPNTIHNVHRFT